MLYRYLIRAITALVIFATLPAAASAQQFVHGTLEGYEPDIIQTQKNTNVTVRVKNTGVATRFRLRLADAPSEWAVSTPTPSWKFLENEDTGEFTTTVNPAGFNGTGQIEMELEAEGVTLGTIVSLGTVILSIQSVPPPGQFLFTAPTRNQQIEGEFLISWTASANAMRTSTSSE